jgi:hypothetical protein
VCGPQTVIEQTLTEIGYHFEMTLPLLSRQGVVIGIEVATGAVATTRRRDRLSVVITG